MKKIENWEKEFSNADEVVSFESIPVGPQICRIIKVEDVTEKEYLKIAFDIADGEYKGFFMDAFNNDTRADKKYPAAGIVYRSYKKSAERFFMAFIKAIEKSNPSFVWDFDETKLKGMLFVANFGEEEFVSEHERKVATKCIEIRSTQALRDNKIKLLEIRKLTEEQEKEVYIEEPQKQEKQETQTKQGTNTAKNDDDLPF